MSQLKAPLAALVVAVVVLLIVLGAKRSAARDRIEQKGRTAVEVSGELKKLEGLRAETAEIRSQTGNELALKADEKDLLARVVSKARSAALLELLRDIAARAAVTGFDRQHDVRDAGLPTRPARLSRLTIQIAVTTDWPRLGALIAEVRGLAPAVVIEEASIHRAEKNVPLLGVRLIVAAFLADGGSAAASTPGPARPLEGPSPFFLASELSSGLSRHEAPNQWTPPRTVLQGVVLARKPQVIVNDESVFVGQSFKVGSETVKVLSASEKGARFQVGDRTYDRDLAPLGK